MKFVSYTQLHRDIVSFAAGLPPIRGVIGIPRSGSMVGSILALHMHLPLTNLDAYLAMRRFPESGERLKIKRSEAPLLLIDDSSWSGRAMNKAVEKLLTLQARDQFKTSVIYGRDDRTDEIVDLVFKKLGDRRFFEWNIWNHGRMQAAWTDLDGVLCPDPPLDDDGERYKKYISNARPLFRPKKVDTIVTCRLEKWRAITEDWLKRSDIEFKRLIMMPYATAKERRKRGNYGAWKAGQVKNTPIPFFVESSLKQAWVVRKLARCEVFCTETMEFLS